MGALDRRLGSGQFKLLLMLRPKDEVDKLYIHPCSLDRLAKTKEAFL